MLFCIHFMLIGFTQLPNKLEFGPQGGRPSRDDPGLWSLVP